ncbi:MAG: hydroxymethylbilane synthase [Desulfatirhabdiaceae bacterium]
MAHTIRVGTRGSQLALWQANWVKSELESRHADLGVELVIIKTKGDKILDVPLARVGGKGLFVKEIEDQLIGGQIDIAVHSMKDMPADIPDGLCIGAVPVRENPCDVLISKNKTPLDGLKPHAVVGTSSLRRAAQLIHLRPDLAIVSLRGNLDTRIRKLESGDMDAIIVAAAGVLRLGLGSHISQYLTAEHMLPAVGQGALCIEIRENDPLTATRIQPLNHEATRITVLGERAFLNRLEGGCQVPIAAFGQIENTTFILDGLVASLDGKQMIRKRASGPALSAGSIGVELAETLLAQGADRILKELKDHADSVNG